MSGSFLIPMLIHVLQNVSFIRWIKGDLLKGCFILNFFSPHYEAFSSEKNAWRESFPSIFIYF